MPIGKNAIKRVSNSGYSNVQTTAPDMENSTVAEAKVEAVALENVAEKAEKPTVKATTKKSTTKKAPATKRATQNIKVKIEIGHICIGDDLPYYLL